MGRLYGLIGTLLTINVAVAIAAVCTNNCNCDWATGEVTCTNLFELPGDSLTSSLVKSIYLRSNNIREISRNKLAAFTNLESLDLSDNKISWIEENTFSDLRHLTDLDLSKNNISFIKSGTFKNLPLLQNLILSWNNIQSIEPQAFVNLPSLFYLNLDHNFLTDLNMSSFEKVHNLSSLYISYNALKAVPGRLCYAIISLTTLYADFNDISSIGDFAFANCVKLSYLSLKRNQISGFSNLSFDCQFLTNDFTSCLSNINSLFLNFNNLTKIPEALGNLNNLNILDLSGNPFDNITSIDFVGLINLQILIISNISNLVIIDEFAFSKLYNIHKIVLSNNQGLGFIPETAFKNLKYLKEVYLGHNSLERLPSNLLNWTSLNIFDARRNRFYCGCDMKWIPTYNRKLTAQVRGVLDNLVCASPTQLKNKLIVRLKQEEFECFDKLALTLKIGFIVAGTFIIIMMVTLLFVKFRKVIYRKARKWYNYKFRTNDEALYIIEHDYYEYIQNRQASVSRPDPERQERLPEATV